MEAVRTVAAIRTVEVSAGASIYGAMMASAIQPVAVINAAMTGALIQGR